MTGRIIQLKFRNNIENNKIRENNLENLGPDVQLELDLAQRSKVKMSFADVQEKNE